MLRTLSRNASNLKNTMSFKRSAAYESLDKENQDTLCAPVFWMSEDDVRSRSVWDWCNAHSSMCPPLHRYYGTATLTPHALHLQGSDQKTRDRAQRRIDLVLYPDQIVDVHRGFDKCFSILEDRSMGMSFKPLRLRYRDESGAIQTLYCVFNFHLITRSDDGKAWSERLEHWVHELGLKAFQQPAQQ